MNTLQQKQKELIELLESQIDYQSKEMFEKETVLRSQIAELEAKEETIQSYTVNQIKEAGADV